MSYNEMKQRLGRHAANPFDGMTINDCLKRIGSKVAKAERRLAAEPGNVNRKLVRDRLAIQLEWLIAQAKAGKVYPYMDRKAKPKLDIKGSWESPSYHQV